MSDKHTEASITAMLASKYSGSDWAFCSKVPNGTGLAKDRTADGLAMSLWPSKGLHLHGFEIKVNRSDWLKEIQDVSKAAAFSRYCHYWWIVAPKGVVKLEEMPADWGLMQAGKNLRNKKAATLRDPETPDHCLLAGIFRACSKQDPAMEAISEARRQGREEGRKNAEKRFEERSNTDLVRLKRDLERVEESVAEFEEKSGVHINRYHGGRIGEAFALAEKLLQLSNPNDLEQIKSRIEKHIGVVTAEIDAAIKLCEQIAEQPEANARLIAAAPELLEAVEAFLRAWKKAGPQGSHQFEKFDTAVRLAEIAKEKAEA